MGKLTKKQKIGIIIGATSAAAIAGTLTGIFVSRSNKPVATVYVQTIDSIVSNVDASVGKYVSAKDFVVNATFTDGTTGEATIGTNCQVWVNETNITSLLTSEPGYLLSTEGPLTFTFKAGEKYDKTKDCSVTVSDLVSSITAKLVTDAPTFTTKSCALASHFEVTANYADGQTTRILSWSEKQGPGYQVYEEDGTTPINKFDVDGYKLITSSPKIVFKYFKHEATVTLNVVATQATIDSTLSNYAEIKGFSEPSIQIAATDSLMPIKEVSKVTKGGTELINGTDYSVSDNKEVITLTDAGLKKPGHIVVTPSVKKIVSLKITPKNGTVFTVGGVIKNTDFDVYGVYENDGGLTSEPLTYNTNYVVRDTNDQIVDFATGYQLSTTVGTQQYLKFIYKSTAAAISEKSDTTTSREITVATITSSIDTTVTDVVVDQLFDPTTKTLTIKTSTTAKAVSGVLSIIKGGTPLTVGEDNDYTVSSASNDYTTITLTEKGMKNLGNLVIKPTTVDLISFDTSTGLITISDDAKARGGSIVIPATVNGNPVKGIAENGFKGATNITSITFEENSNLTSIGDSAFEGCTGLTSITLPESLTSIGTNAFAGSKLTTLTIPANVTTLSDKALNGLSLDTLYIDSSTVANFANNNGRQTTCATTVYIKDTVTLADTSDIKITADTDTTTIDDYVQYTFKKTTFDGSGTQYADGNLTKYCFAIANYYSGPTHKFQNHIRIQFDNSDNTTYNAFCQPQAWIMNESETAFDYVAVPIENINIDGTNRYDLDYKTTWGETTYTLPSFDPDVGIRGKVDIVLNFENIDFAGKTRNLFYFYDKDNMR